MATDVGVRIGVEGEREFRTALSAINSQIRNLNSEMRNVVSSFDGMEDAEQSAAARSDVLNRSIEATQQKITLLSSQYDKASARLNELGEALSRAQQEFGQNSAQAARAQNAYNNQVRTVSELSRQINDANTDLNRFQRELRDTGDAADDMGRELRDSADEAGGFGSTLKNAIVGGGISGAVQRLIGNITQLIDETTEYRKIMGTLEVSSQAAGYTAEQTTQTFQRLYGVLGDDQTAATATANLQALGLSQTQLTQLTDGAIGAWAKYGDSIPIDGLAEAINETVKVGTVTGTFADVLNWAGTSEDDFNAKLQATKDPAERANLVLQELANQGLMQSAEAWRNNNAELYEANIANNSLTDTMSQFAEILSPIVTTVKEGLNGVLQSVLGLVAVGQEGGIGAVFEQITTSMSGFAQNLAANLPGLMEMGSELLNSIISGVAATLPGIVTSAGQIITSFLQGLTAGFPSVIQNGVEMLNNLANGIIQSIPALVAQLPQIISAFINFIYSALPQIVNAGVDILLNLVNGIINSIPQLVSQIPQIITALTSAIASNLPKILQAGIKILLKLAEGIIKAIPQLVAQLPQIISAIIDGLNALIQGIKDVGKNIVQGLWNGISSAVGWLKDKVAGWASGLINSIKSKFKIASPSKLMRDEIGVMIARGLGLGLKKGTPYVERMANRLSDALTKEIEKTNAEIEKMQQAKIQRQADQELKEYKKQIAEKEKELAEAEGEARQNILDQIAELEAQWNEKQLEAARQAEQDAANARLEELEKFREEYESAIEEIQKSQESMTQKLKDYGDLFEEVDGKIELTDLRDQIDQIREYGVALEELKDRGAPDDLLAEVTEMSVEDAVAYTQALLDMTDQEYQDYIHQWNRKQYEAQQIASQFYKSELAALDSEYVQKVPETLSDLKDQLYSVGTNSAQGLANGLLDAKNVVVRAAITVASAAATAMQKYSKIASPSKLMRDEVGRYLTEGVAVGMLDSIGQVRQAAQTVSDAATSGMGGDFYGMTTPGAGLTVNVPPTDFSAILAELQSIRQAIQEGKILSVNGQKLTDVVTAGQRTKTIASGRTVIPV